MARTYFGLKTATSFCETKAGASCGGESIAEDAKATQRCTPRQCRSKQMSGLLLLADGMESTFLPFPGTCYRCKESSTILALHLVA